MAKDDYHVIVYKILAYLYNAVKRGKFAEEAMLKPGGPIVGNISECYWGYILYNMSERKLIDGISFGSLGRIPYPKDFDNGYITPAGIEYLCFDPCMKKVAKRINHAYKGKNI